MYPQLKAFPYFCFSNIAMHHGARNIGISNERRRERVPSGRTSEDTYEMSDDDLVSKKTGA